MQRSETGVIIDPVGYVLTNWHVVAGYDAGIVFFKPAVGTEPAKDSSYGVKLIAMDEAADLAILKIIKPPSGLTAVKFGEALYNSGCRRHSHHRSPPWKPLVLQHRRNKPNS